MSERPILFSGEMVRATLDGRKSQTRRAISSGNCHFGSAPREFWEHADFSRAWRDGQKGEFRNEKYVVTGRGDGEYLHVPCHVEDEGQCERCDHWGWPTTAHRLWPNFGATHTWQQTPEPGYKPPASRLWVKETFFPAFTRTEYNHGCVYCADYGHRIDLPSSWNPPGGWKPSIFMPRWASRIILEITAVRVERVQDISKQDCIAEGMTGLEDINAGWHQSYAQLWDAINAKRGFGWEKNPFVWVIEFKRLSGAIG